MDGMAAMGYGDMADVQNLQNVRHQHLGLQMDG